MATTPPRSEREGRARDYFARASRYLSHNHRIAIRAEIVREMVGELRGRRILDLGCGNGGVSAQFLPANAVTMVDQSAEMLAAARALAPSARHVRGDLQAFAGSQPFDLVVCLGILAHVESSEAVLAAIARNLSEGGRCVLQLSDASKPLNRLAAAFRRVRSLVSGSAWTCRATPFAATVDLAGRHGLRVVDRRDHLLILPGLPKVIRGALVPYDRLVRRSPLARHGVDTLLLLEKAQG